MGKERPGSLPSSACSMPNSSASSDSSSAHSRSVPEGLSSKPARVRRTASPQAVRSQSDSLLGPEDTGSESVSVPPPPNGAFLTHNTWPGARRGPQRAPPQSHFKKAAKGERSKVLLWQVCLFSLGVGGGPRSTCMPDKSSTQSHTLAHQSSEENDGELPVHPKVDTMLMAAFPHQGARGLAP